MATSRGPDDPPNGRIHRGNSRSFGPSLSVLSRERELTPGEWKKHISSENSPSMRKVGLEGRERMGDNAGRMRES